MAQPDFIVSYLTRKDLQRFFSKIRLDYSKMIHNTPCWIWTGNDDGAGGYGYFKWKRRNVRVHRFMFAWLVHQLPFGLHNGQLDHLCRNRRCCNPVHLEFVDQRINRQRRMPEFCIRGHEFSPDNVWINKSGGRVCKQCSELRFAQHALRNMDRFVEKYGSIRPARMARYLSLVEKHGI